MGKVKKKEKIVIGQRWTSMITGRMIEVEKLLMNCAVCSVVHNPGNPREEGCLVHIFFPEFFELRLKGEDDVSTMGRPADGC